MAASGIVISRTFTPPAAGVVKVSVNFNIASTSSGSGSPNAQPFCTQFGSTTYQGGTVARNGSFALFAAFTVSGGSAIEVGLFGNPSGAGFCDFTEVNLLTEFSPT